MVGEGCVQVSSKKELWATEHTLQETHAGGVGVDCMRESYPSRALSACRSAA